MKVEFIAAPVPERLAELQERQVNQVGMQDAIASSPGNQSRSVIIKTFPTSQDVHVSGSLNAGGDWESDMVNRVYNLWLQAGSKGNFLDVGANIGSWALPIAAAFHGTSQVVSVEAMPPIADHFRAGIVANKADNIVLFPYAVGQPDALDSVQMALNPTNKGGSAVVGNKGWTGGAVQKFRVGLTTIDSILSQDATDMSNIFYGKFDIEGNEGRAIAGAQQFFTQHAPCVLFMELNDGFLTNTGTSRTAIETQLSTFGYDTAGVIQLGCNYEYRQKDFQGCLTRLH